MTRFFRQVLDAHGLNKSFKSQGVGLGRLKKINASGLDFKRRKSLATSDALLFTAYVDRNQTGVYDSDDQLLLQVFDANADRAISNGDVYHYVGTYDSSGTFTELDINDTITNYSVQRLTRTVSWTDPTGSQGITLTTLLGNGLNGFSNGYQTSPNFFQNLVTPIASIDGTLANQTAITYGTDPLSQASGSIPFPMRFA